ncbi:MAG TPA: hypothetical protein VLT33_06410 [Labilithrix sp.]|nr:hypothetical protein [Labilithrix sp.]
MLAGFVFLRSRLCAPVLVAILCLAPSARAQEKEGDLERARALFDQAGELERQGQWPAAQDRLRAALRIRETPNLRYALGWALENDDKLLESRTEYELALRLAQRASNDEVSALASTRIAEVDRKTPLLQVRIRGLIARDTHVLVDGREVIIRGDAGTLPVDPGARIVRVERVGRPPTEQTVTVGRGVLRVVEVKGDEGVTVSDENGAATDRKPAVLPWVLMGGGGALLITGVALLVSSSGDAQTRDDKTAQWCDATACVNGTATRPETTEAALMRHEAYDAASRGNTKQIAFGVLGGVGAVGIGVGVYLLLHRSRGEETAKASRLAIDASPVAGGATASASFVF